MVLDAKALTWAAQNGIDTAKLKAAKVPIYGKWYFPEIPAGVPVVNLETGEREVFPARMLTGELIYAPEEDLRRAGLLPADFPEEPLPELREEESRALHRVPMEPLLAMTRPVGFERETTTALVPVEEQQALVEEDHEALAGLHVPSGSIAPFVLGVGFSIALLGAITNPIILVVGLVWMLVGAIGWIRIGLLEQRAAHGHHE
ncbi:MAG TPA: hypothetical protein VFG86_15450 [Chloroflexota bacterium]|jgi:hypothetical protein|nr:hypothetical protein [Chloroflexota bacterium]